jgi:hypothetical protein
LPIGGQAFQRKMAAGVGGLKLAFVLFGIFIRLAPKMNYKMMLNMSRQKILATSTSIKQM